MLQTCAWPAIHGWLEQALRRLFPAAAAAPVSHRWGGFFAAPRDWSTSVDFDRTSGLARAGGYSGHGVVASSLAGPTLADLITGTESDLVGLPWIQAKNGIEQRESRKRLHRDFL